ncbi:uncharacterized protein LAESUDRAFT_743246 [Laetiporus sulphureus 93-53]|uniref:Methyltransferase domain-containing protein n=1 Tax=Laetiporus sulphureus 93-53 TaxID=1314785 RepID=A0A165EAZ5_9APHY|nr:uncharacterized protein LAESUDRAFT_743246 [Laetiporus sulphureus 93-53]KZT06627.1 hypothetical protein LAESUDRAFT_743246 [Laetiporus sulphureus 93-53]
MTSTADYGINRYYLDENELAFFKTQTGIQDENELEQHILGIQADAYKVHPYNCIRLFAFTKLKVSLLPAYGQLLKLGKERKGAILLDLGCCFGNDIRKAIADGFPIENAIASDIEPMFWELGHHLFKSTKETFPVHFLPGSVLDPTFLKLMPPFYSPPETPAPPLSSLQHLTSLAGHVSVIHVSSVFHLFSEMEQLQLARSIAGLLSPLPGSIIFGEHSARPEKGYRVEQLKKNTMGTHTFCHSPESWVRLWDGEVFRKGAVKVGTVLREIDRSDLTSAAGVKFWVMGWSVTRL